MYLSRAVRYNLHSCKIEVYCEKTILRVCGVDGGIRKYLDILLVHKNKSSLFFEIPSCFPPQNILYLRLPTFAIFVGAFVFILQTMK